jgi:cellulose synthase/poly-beta-1,6-N-acetylglucosamine synthase-like glycosyltransferase
VFYIALFIAVIFFLLVTGVYGLYFLLVIKTAEVKKYVQLTENSLKESLSWQEVPKVSILIPAFNEESVISRKLHDIAALNYPHEKIEVLVIDDCSMDRTASIAQQALNTFGLQGKIIKNSERIGVNACYNRGVAESDGYLVLMTDADVMLDRDALLNGVKIFRHLERVGGITGKMVPVSNDSTAAVAIEDTYRNYFDSMSIAESAIHSTFPGNGPFLLLKRSLLSPISTQYGTSDGNISLSIVRRSFRFVYVREIFFYEPVANTLREQRRQKTRRAARVIQAALANRDMLFKSDYGCFGTVVFPLRFAMLVLCPTVFFGGLVAAFLGSLIVSAQVALLMAFLFVLFTWMGTKVTVRPLNLFSSFVMHQLYLERGLLLSRRKLPIWTPISRSAREDTQPGQNGETQLSDAIMNLTRQKRGVYAVELNQSEKRIDVGTPESYWKALTLTYDLGYRGPEAD